MDYGSTLTEKDSGKELELNEGKIMVVDRENVDDSPRIPPTITHTPMWRHAERESEPPSVNMKTLLTNCMRSCLGIFVKTNIKKKSRVLSLDVQRGVVITFMIIVNFGTMAFRSDVYYQFDHAPWGKGVTMADLIQPSFLFVVGYACGIVMGRRKPNTEDAVQSNQRKRFAFCWRPFSMNLKTWNEIKNWTKLFRRAFLLYFIGWFLGITVFILFMGKGGDSGMRIEDVWVGVLQRISVCYLVVAIVVKCFEWTITQVSVIASIHMIYILFMFGYPLNCADGRAGVITETCSGEYEVDKSIFGAENINYKYLTNGVLSTLPAITSTYLGTLYFIISKSTKEKVRTGTNYAILTHWSVLSSILLLLSWICGIFLQPMNKYMWSTAFTLFSAAINGFLLVFLYLIVDVLKYRKWAMPFVWIGVNSLFMWVIPMWIAGACAGIPSWEEEKPLFALLIDICIRSWVRYDHFVNLLVSLIYLMLYLPLLYVMYWKNVFISV